MLILNKKRIMVMLCMIMVSVLAFSFYKADLNTKTVETVSLPVTNKVIVVDARTWDT